MTPRRARLVAAEVELPAPYREALISRAGPAAQVWLASVPTTLAVLADRWAADIEPVATRYGWFGVVFLGRRGGQACALKISWCDADVASEIASLRAWSGRGAALLLEADVEAGALLLEGLDPDRSLHVLAPLDAAAAAGALIRELAIPSDVPVLSAEALLRGLQQDLVDNQRLLGSPVPRRVFDAAVALVAELADLAPVRTLVDLDLHYGNVLAGRRRPWLAIDPKPALGPPEMSVAELVWTRIDEVSGPRPATSLLTSVADAGRLDVEQAWAWTVVRTTAYWLWAISAGLTEDPRRCAKVLEEL